jgi:hypothetical protein
MNIGHGCAFYRPTDDRLFLSSCRPTATQFESAHRDFLSNSPAQSGPAHDEGSVSQPTVNLADQLGVNRDWLFLVNST